MTKTHYAHGPHGNACGRASSRGTTNVYEVTCLLCKRSPQFIAAEIDANILRQEKFMAQEPRQFVEPWRQTTQTYMVCRGCEGDLFRMGDRTCHGHYQNYHCANCGNVESRLTETGMSF